MQLMGEPILAEAGAAQIRDQVCQVIQVMVVLEV
jgi:hypothetical protein